MNRHGLLSGSGAEQERFPPALRSSASAARRRTRWLAPDAQERSGVLVVA
ncbi:MAG TPA: hypothetical protein PKM43_04005 [Verrucomicrobiota bacterium]|nr:hypothetical protein [Verrucomicrobiota bacterium]HRZ38404.1 hypothetical protein [Candidatus Paceibacterota bacterium]HRZ54694.1 hypothetical protein [Candidatus Paceibacterota bacterium]